MIKDGNRIISLNEKDLLELQAILLDKDEKAALEFLRKIKEKWRSSKSVCRP